VLHAAPNKARREEEDAMERLAFERDQKEIEAHGARTLRGVIIVNAVILLVGIALGAMAPERDAAAGSGGSGRSLDDGAKPQPGRRF
jgi:hypothetical protein